MGRRGPLADNYPAAVALVVCSLIPYLALTAGAFPVFPQIGRSLGLTSGDLDLTIVLSTGGYAVGTVLAVQFAMHLRPRRMLVAYEAMFVVASLLAAWAPTGDVFMGAFVFQGLGTSLMLIAAVPPLVTRWPPAKMPITATIMNLCIFGAVAVGPTIGGVEAAAGLWRPLFWGVAGVAALALVFSLLTFEDQGPQDRSAPWDPVAIGLAAVGCSAAFFGAGELAAGRLDAASVVTLVVGTAMIVALVVHQYRRKRPLMPLRQLATTMPVTGILVALVASSSSFGLMVLVLVALEKTTSPMTMGLVFLPEFAAAVGTATLFGRLFRTRFVPVLALSGLAMLVGASVILGTTATTNAAAVAAGTGLIGLGVGASVSPALFMAGLSLRSKELQRVFAMIELLRGVTAFLAAPILLFLAVAIGGSEQGGLDATIWICLGIAGAGGLVCTALFLAGKGWLEAPDLERWQGEGQPAWESPPLLARARRRTPERV